MLEAEQNSYGLPRAFVTYDELPRDWAATLDRAGAVLGLEWPVDPAAAAFEADRFLSDSMRHNTVPDIVVEADEALSRWVKEAYRAHKTAAADEDGRSLGQLSRIRRELAEAGWLFDPVVTTLLGDTARLREGNADRDTRIATMEGEVCERGARIGALEGEVSERHTEIEPLSGELARARATSWSERRR